MIIDSYKFDVNSGVGDEIFELISEMYPICRSITGQGVRQTYDIIKKHLPIVTLERAA